MLNYLVYIILASILVLALVRDPVNVIGGAALVTGAQVLVLYLWSLLPDYGLLVVLPIWIWL